MYINNDYLLECMERTVKALESIATNTAPKPNESWAGLARELYRGHFTTHGVCYFCGWDAGHSDNCQWSRHHRGETK